MNRPVLYGGHKFLGVARGQNYLTHFLYAVIEMGVILNNMPKLL